MCCTLCLILRRPAIGMVGTMGSTPNYDCPVLLRSVLMFNLTCEVKGLVKMC